MEQMTFDDMETLTPEKIAYLRVEPSLLETLSKYYVDENQLAYADTKSNYGSVTLGRARSVIFRLKMQGAKTYFSVSKNYARLLPDDTKIEKIPSDQDYIRIPISSAPDIDQYIPSLQAILGAQIESYPSEYGCCSRYEQCSDAKRCVNPDKGIALSCYYHKNLRAGKIFYGKNKNV